MHTGLWKAPNYDQLLPRFPSFLSWGFQQENQNGSSDESSDGLSRCFSLVGASGDYELCIWRVTVTGAAPQSHPNRTIPHLFVVFANPAQRLDWGVNPFNSGFSDLLPTRGWQLSKFCNSESQCLKLMVAHACWLRTSSFSHLENNSALILVMNTS